MYNMLGHYISAAGTYTEDITGNVIVNRPDVTLKGMKIEYYLEDEVFPLSRGGIKYMTYNYDDAAWDAFVAEQGGTLNYK